MSAQWRNDRAYVAKREALRRQAQRNNATCHLCGRPIDYSLPWHHAMAFTADHVEAVGTGGSMTGELRPAHRSCNSRRGKRPLNTLKTPQTPKTSRNW